MSVLKFLKPGDTAPPISAKDHNNRTFNLDRYKGKKVVLFFYPKDDTPTCTKEACNLRDNYSKLQRRKIKLVGISPDSVKKHQKFRNKYDLPFTLLEDTDKKIVTDYGVWGEKLFMGMKITSVHRTTFIIDEDGKIQHIIDQVKSSEHADQILSLLDMP